MDDNMDGLTSVKRSSGHRSVSLWTLSIGMAVLLGLMAMGPGLFAQQKSGGSSRDSRGQDPYGTLIEDLNAFIRQNYVDEVDADKLYEGALKGMFEALDDPYSMFLDREAMRSMNDTTTGEFGGLGLYIDKQRTPEGKLVPNGYVEVVSPIEGTPAFQEGMQSGDLIVEIDGVSTAELALDEAVDKLRGAVDSTVEIRVFRGKSMDFKKTLTRKVIEIPTVKTAMIGDVAYVRIIQFTPLTVEQLSARLKELRTRKYKAMVLDLRNNPGGVLDGAVDIADFFFDDGVLVSTRSRIRSENHVFKAGKGTLVDPSVPLVCLVNEGSASAAEILSGALKDRGRAVLIGNTTYGKGSVQTVRRMGDTGFRMTIARYYTPSDISIDKVGIAPDVKVVEDPLGKEEEAGFVEFQEKGLTTILTDRFGKDLAASRSAIMKELESRGIHLPERLVMRLLRREQDHRDKVSREYDLEYDNVLLKALEVIRNNQVDTLLKARPAVDPDGIPATPLPLPKAR